MGLPDNRAEFERLRGAYFADPSKPAKPNHAEAAAFLVRQLLGVKDGGPLQGKDPLAEFLTTYADKMQGARRFDHLSMAQIHPNGFMPGVLAHFGSTLKNNNTIVIEVSPVETKMEEEVIQWMNDKITGYNKRASSGALVSGGTFANVTGLMVAREKLTKESYWRADRTAVVLGTEMSHYSLSKNAALLAPSELISVEKIPLEKDGYGMDTNALGNRVRQLRRDGTPIMAIVANAGMTETGLVDRIADIADIAEEDNIYLHIDAAYGGPYALSKKRHLFNGTQRSNSVTVDPHKNLYTPYPGGAILFRSAGEHSLLGGLNADGSDYMFKEDTAGNLGKRRLEGSMGGQAAASTWAVIKTLGVRGLSHFLNHALDVTDHAHKAIEGSKFFQPVFEPDLNTICFRAQDPRVAKVLKDLREEAKFTEDVCKTLENETGIYLSTTDLPIPAGRNQRIKAPAIRLVVTNPYTETQHIDQMLDSLQDIWDRQMTKAAKAV